MSRVTPEGIEEIRSRLESTGAPQVAWDTFNAMVEAATGKIIRIPEIDPRGAKKL